MEPVNLSKQQRSVKNQSLARMPPRRGGSGVVWSGDACFAPVAANPQSPVIDGTYLQTIFDHFNGMENGLRIHFDTLIRPSVGADLSRPQPIYRPLVHVLQS